MKSLFISFFIGASLFSSAQFHLEATVAQVVPNEGKFAKSSFFLGGYGLAIGPNFELNEKWQVGLRYEINGFINFSFGDYIPADLNAKVESIAGTITFRPNVDRIIHIGLAPGLYFVKGGYSVPEDTSQPIALHEPYKSFGTQLNIDWYSGRWKVGTGYTVTRDVHFITLFKVGFRT